MERFWKKVQKTDWCWIWTASFFTNGYGQFRHGSRTDGTRKLDHAHRMAYRLEVGQIPEGMLVCHKCDNKKCVNPDHLFLGTSKDNTQDMIKKGRAGLKQYSKAVTPAATTSESTASIPI